MFHLDDDIKTTLALGTVDCDDIVERDQLYGFIYYMASEKLAGVDSSCCDSDYIGYTLTGDCTISGSQNIQLFIGNQGRTFYVPTGIARVYSNKVLEKQNKI